MVFAIIGENCSGKSTLAEKIKETLGGEIVTGKDYLRMAKSESEAISLFREKLRRAVSGDNIIYVIADPEHVKLLPDGTVRILVSADLETIKERFRARMHGNLPAPVFRIQDDVQRPVGLQDRVAHGRGIADVLAAQLLGLFKLKPIPHFDPEI